AGDRRGTAVIGWRDLRLGLGGIDDQGRQAVAVEGESEAEPDQPAAEDDDVRAVHFPRLAMQPCNAKRLTRESREAHEGIREHLGHIEMAATMAQRDRPGRIAHWRDGTKRLARRSRSFFGGLLLSATALFALVALVSYHPSDPSLNTDAAGP